MFCFLQLFLVLGVDVWKGSWQRERHIYKDYDVEIPETLSAYGYGDSPLTFVSLSDYNGMRKLQGMDSVDLLENNYRILYNKENVRGLAEQFHDKSTILLLRKMYFLR